MRGRQVRVCRYPAGPVTPADFEVVTADVPAPGPGEVLVRNEWTSVDPGLRLRLRPDAPAGYFPAFPLGRPMDGIMTVGRVLDSRAAGFAEGDLVWHAQGWREYAVVEAGRPQLGGLGTLTRLAAGARPPQHYLGPLGGMGLTAYAGLTVLGALETPGVLWVSAAAGAVGSLAAQIARLTGNEVVGSAGSDAKVAWLRERCGVRAFNHRTGTLADSLREQAPGGIDYYFDAVGGDHLGAALDHLRREGSCALRFHCRVPAFSPVKGGGGAIGRGGGVEGATQPVPGGVQGPDPARLPGQQPSAPARSDAGAGGGLAGRGRPGLAGDGLRRPRRRRAGPAGDARGEHDGQNPGTHPLDLAS
jgi:NADPH-dependent curcumin reductase CurA